MSTTCRKLKKQLTSVLRRHMIKAQQHFEHQMENLKRLGNEQSSFLGAFWRRRIHYVAWWETCTRTCYEVFRLQTDWTHTLLTLRLFESVFCVFEFYHSRGAEEPTPPGPMLVNAVWNKHKFQTLDVNYEQIQQRQICNMVWQPNEAFLGKKKNEVTFSVTLLICFVLGWEGWLLSFQFE